MYTGFNAGFAIPDSLTREEGSVDPNVKHPCQTVPPGSPDTPYLSKIPFFLGASTPQFQIGLLIDFRALDLKPLSLTVTLNTVYVAI
jgi:hypothetical protein